MSGGLIDKVYIGLDNAPAAFDIKARILGPVSACDQVFLFPSFLASFKRKLNYLMSLTE